MYCIILFSEAGQDFILGDFLNIKLALTDVQNYNRPKCMKFEENE